MKKFILINFILLIFINYSHGFCQIYKDGQEIEISGIFLTSHSEPSFEVDGKSRQFPSIISDKEFDFICTDDDYCSPVKDVKCVGLAMSGGDYNLFKKYYGRRVVVTGSLFGAHNKNHRTPVYISVSSVKEKKNNELRSNDLKLFKDSIVKLYVHDKTISFETKSGKLIASDEYVGTEDGDTLIKLLNQLIKSKENVLISSSINEDGFYVVEEIKRK